MKTHPPVPSALFFPPLLFFALHSIACGEQGDSNGNGNGDARAAAAFGVVRSDRTSSAIALLDRDGSIIDSSVLDSGSRPPGLVTALSGDVALATTARDEGGVLNVLDRFQTDVFTRYDLASDEIMGQVRVRDGFPTNPQDFAIVEENRGWISRLGVNTQDDEPPIDRGNDVIEVDLDSFELTGRRVSLAPLTATGTAMRDGGPVEVDVFARPGLMAVVDSTLVIALTFLSRDFDASSPGMVALVDVGTENLDAFALPTESRNCGSLRPVPGEPFLVLVACSGFALPFGEETQVRASSGVYMLDFTDDPPEISKSWAPRPAPRPLAVQSVIPLDDRRFLAVAFGQLGAKGDEAFIVDLDTGESTSLFQADDAFALGTGAYDPSTGLLILPDASSASSGLRRFVEGSDGVFTADGLRPFTDQPLPPRSVYLLPREADVER